MITIGTPNFNTYKFSLILSYHTVDSISSIPYTKPHSEKEGKKKKKKKKKKHYSPLYTELYKNTRAHFTQSRKTLCISLYMYTLTFITIFTTQNI